MTVEAALSLLVAFAAVTALVTEGVKSFLDSVKCRYITNVAFNTSPYITYKDSNKAYVDNKGLNYQMLINAGIQKAHITIDKNDTFAENESFFSYRRDKACGRHLSFIVRKE